MVSLHTVEIPGYREALKREREARSAAWLGGTQELCGEQVLPLTMRRVVLLERAMNGFVVPCRFFNSDEAAAHALQVIYYCKPGFREPKGTRRPFWATVAENIRIARLTQRVMRRNSAVEVITEVREWMDDAFADAPGGGGDGPDHPIASWPAYIMDCLAAGGYRFGADEALDMPLTRLWQLCRVGLKRAGAQFSNKSDELAANYLAGRAN